MRHLILVLGDQLDAASSAFDGFDPAQDALWMAEVAEESTHVRSSQVRTAVFLAAMRHFAADRRAQGWTVHYARLESGATTLGDALAADLQRLRPAGLVLTAPGDWRVLQALRATAQAHGLPLDLRDDRHFYATVRDFSAHAKGRKQLRMEYFYREMRQRHRVLVEGADGDQPVGGQWNFDADNRKSFPKAGPGWIPEPARFEPDAITREVLALVQRRFPDHPGSLAEFGWPVTPAQAREALQRFIDDRLIAFGAYQDAMWTDTPFGWHSLLSVALNLHLIDPREVVAAAETAWRERGLPLAAVEGFIRQILGWREFIRGVYWLDMPGLREANHYGHQRKLPAWYWTGNTRMACMRDTIGQTLQHGYAHHIQRLMVTGQFALLAELSPQQVADWYLAVYVDAIEWVELPNVAGMALFANGGRFTSKPYVASGQYIDRMSNYCKGCAYAPAQRSGEGACPVTTLYWNFLDRHETELAASPRTALMVKNLQKLDEPTRASIRTHAAYLLDHLDGL